MAAAKREGVGEGGEGRRRDGCDLKDVEEEGGGGVQWSREAR